jgi:uncharacterized protein YyaL (SSP411 family)
MLNRPCEIVLVPGDSATGPQELTAAEQLIRQRFLPNKVVAAPPAVSRDQATSTPRDSVDCVVPLLADKKSIDGKVTAYICENYACQAPTVGLEALAAALGQR